MTAVLPPALVLTAGLGTRLWPLTTRVAKPAVPLAGRALVERILADLSQQGVRDAVLNLHHLPSTITAIVGDGSQYGLRVRYSLEPVVLGSAGGPRHALPLIDADPFLVVNGDTLTDLDLPAMVEQHRRSGARVTMAVVPNPAPEQYGGVVAGPDHIVTGFTRRGGPADAWHFVGVQVVNRDVFAPLEDNVPANSVGGVYRDLLASEPGAVRVFTSTGRFIDVGTPRDCLAAARFFARGASLVEPGARVAEDAVVDDTLVWRGAVVESGCRLEDCIVADVAVPEGLQAAACCLVPADGLTPRPGDRLVGGCLVVPFEAAAR